MKAGEVERVESREELPDLVLDPVRAARCVRLDVERHVRIVQRHAQQRPAVREDEAHALIGGSGDPEPLVFGALLECGEDVLSVCLDVVGARDLDADLACLGGMAQILDEVAEGFALGVCLCRCDEKLYREVGAVVEVVVLAERAMP